MISIQLHMAERRQRSTHAPRSAPNCACPSRLTALRMRHDQHPTAHARGASPHCACPSDGTALRMRPGSVSNCACPSDDSALRMRHDQYRNAHARASNGQGRNSTDSPRRGTRDRENSKNDETDAEPHPRSASNCSSPSDDSALRMRHDQHPTAHARASSPHCACVTISPQLRMPELRHSTAHASRSAPNCACPSSGTALRMPERRHRTAHARRSASNCACPSVKRIWPLFHRFATRWLRTPQKQQERRDGRGAAPQLLALRSLFVVTADENAVRLGLWEEQVTSIGKRPRKPKKASHTQQTSANCLTVSILKSLNK